jgi:hypothetical protein
MAQADDPTDHLETKVERGLRLVDELTTDAPAPAGKASSPAGGIRSGSSQGSSRACELRNLPGPHIECSFEYEGDLQYELPEERTLPANPPGAGPHKCQLWSCEAVEAEGEGSMTKFPFCAKCKARWVGRCRG